MNLNIPLLHTYSHWLVSVGQKPLKHIPWLIPHEYPFFLYTSTGQSPLIPVHSSDRSHSLDAGLHTVPRGSNWIHNLIKLVTNTGRQKEKRKVNWSSFILKKLLIQVHDHNYYKNYFSQLFFKNIYIRMRGAWIVFNFISFYKRTVKFTYSQAHIHHAVSYRLLTTVIANAGRMLAASHVHIHPKVTLIHHATLPTLEINLRIKR